MHLNLNLKADFFSVKNKSHELIYLFVFNVIITSLLPFQHFWNRSTDCWNISASAFSKFFSVTHLEYLICFWSDIDINTRIIWQPKLLMCTYYVSHHFRSLLWLLMTTIQLVATDAEYVARDFIIHPWFTVVITDIFSVKDVTSKNTTQVSTVLLL